MSKVQAALDKVKQSLANARELREDAKTAYRVGFAGTRPLSLTTYKVKPNGGGPQSIARSNRKPTLNQMEQPGWMD